MGACGFVILLGIGFFGCPTAVKIDAQRRDLSADRFLRTLYLI